MRSVKLGPASPHWQSPNARASRYTVNAYKAAICGLFRLGHVDALLQFSFLLYRHFHPASRPPHASFRWKMFSLRSSTNDCRHKDSAKTSLGLKIPFRDDSVSGLLVKNLRRQVLFTDPPPLFSARTPSFVRPRGFVRPQTWCKQAIYAA